MTIELDHLFTFTGTGAPEVERLVRFGLTEGEPNTHPGLTGKHRGGSKIFGQSCRWSFAGEANEEARC